MGSNWINKEKRIWIPDEAKKLQHTMFACAHCHVNGHRGVNATTNLLKEYCFWNHMQDSVSCLIKTCLGCMKFNNGQVYRPIPLGSQLTATKPGVGT